MSRSLGRGSPDLDGDRLDRHGPLAAYRRPRAETVAFGRARRRGTLRGEPDPDLANGIRHFPDELERLEREGIENFEGLIAFTREHGIECDLEETGVPTLADQAYQVDEFRAWVDEAADTASTLRSPTGMLPRPRSTRRSGTPASTGRPLATSWSTGSSRAAASPASRGNAAWRSPSERGDEARRVAGAVVIRTAAGATVRAGHVVVATLRLLRLAPAALVAVAVYAYVLVSGTAHARRTRGDRRKRARACPTRATSSTTFG